MTPDKVICVHREMFYVALLAHDLHKLLEIHADKYILDRSHGSVLSKSQILKDLKLHPITSKKLALEKQVVRIHRPVGIQTGVARTVSICDGNESDTRSQMISGYAQENGKRVLVHFQTTLF